MSVESSTQPEPKATSEASTAETEAAPTEPKPTAEADTTAEINATETAAEPQAAADIDVAALQKQLDTAEQKSAEHWEALLRQKAEMDNLRKRTERELDNARKFALEKFATELLAVKDSMELGLEAAAQPDTELKTVHEGMDLTLKMFGDVLEKFGVVTIAPQGEKFDPQFHEAMAMQPTADAEDGTVLIVHQKGYQLNERLIRPARVVVAKAIPAATDEA